MALKQIHLQVRHMLGKPNVLAELLSWPNLVVNPEVLPPPGSPLVAQAGVVHDCPPSPGRPSSLAGSEGEPPQAALEQHVTYKPGDP